MALAKIKLSGSTDGRMIPVAAVATPGTTIHTVAGLPLEELWLWVVNITGAEAWLTLEKGGAGVDDEACHQLPIPPNSGLICVMPGLVLGNSLAVKAFSQTANALNIDGYVITGI